MYLPSALLKVIIETIEEQLLQQIKRIRGYMSVRMYVFTYLGMVTAAHVYTYI